MNHWYLISVALLLSTQPALAANYDLLSDVTPVRAEVVNTDQQVRRSPATPNPDLREGDLWLCSVGQKPEVNVQAFNRAKAKGWGFWSFAPHRTCPAGVYLGVVSGGGLRATGGDPWTDNRPAGDPLTNFVSMPSASGSRGYYTPQPSRSTSYCADGSCYGSAPVTQGYSYSMPASGGCSDGSCGVGRAPSGWRSGPSSYSSGSGGWFGGRIIRGFFGGGCGSGGGCSSCGS